MIDTWEPKTNYFVILNQGQMKQVLGEFIEEKMKYKPKKDGTPRLLEDVMRGVKYLAGNKIAISIQINNALYDEIEQKDGSIINARGVEDYITESDFELAKLQFGVTEFLSQEEYNALETIEINV